MNSYVIGCARTREGAVIDSGGETDRMLELAAGHHLTIIKLLQTHAHIDHIMGLNEMKAVTGAPICLHPKDAPTYAAAGMQAMMFGLQMPDPPPVDAALSEGEVVALGTLKLTVMFTPGHAPGHVCFHDRDNGVLFGGDLLFRGSIGRIDLPGANPREMMLSLRRIMDELPDETIVYPGHMEPTTIGRERRSNPFILDIL